MTRRKLGTWLAGALAATAILGFASAAPAADTKLTVIVFQGLQNLPLYAAEEHGFFKKRGLDVEIKITPNSQELRDGLAQGRYQIAHAAVDNAVAMYEQAKVPIVVVLGGDNGFNNLYVQPEIKSFADLRGKTVVVDAVDTAYAFQLYEMLEQKGLKRGDYTVKPVGATYLRIKAMQADKNNAASMLNPPFSIQAEQSGLKNMGLAVDAIGPYQANAAFVLPAWAKANSDVLVRYIQAYVEGLRWSLDPAHKAEAIGYLETRLKLSPEIAAKSYAIATDPKNGMVKDAKIDMEGFKNTLRLRAKQHGDWGGTPPSPDKYLDLSYYQRAVSGL